MIIYVPCRITLILSVGMQFFIIKSVLVVMHGFIIVSCAQTYLPCRALLLFGAYIESYKAIVPCAADWSEIIINPCITLPILV